MPIKIAYLHTSHVLIPMFTDLSRRQLPGIEQFHMVDESLIQNTISAKELTKATIRRVINMVQSAREGGADGVVVTCSSIGPAATMARALFDFPVVRVDEPMAEEAVRVGRRIGVAATLRTTLEPTVALLRAKALDAGRDVDVIESLCEDAFTAVLSGDTRTHDRLLSDSLARLRTSVDVVVLAQASMARVVANLPGNGCAPVLSSPELAVRRLGSLLFPDSPVAAN
ncbi:MAG TPA: aspartate/glutamate racemase family protein [Bryobacteraceae bacterium]|jgi:Asp/Glu/hydantoin racemase|nr:aspartate/glutamate racemase family protein [Bryobacteraceae bacterium]